MLKGRKIIHKQNQNSMHFDFLTGFQIVRIAIKIAILGIIFDHVCNTAVTAGSNTAVILL